MIAVGEIEKRDELQNMKGDETWACTVEDSRVSCACVDEA